MRRLLYVAAAACVLFAGCKKEIILPKNKVTTLEVTSLYATYARMKGEMVFWHDGPEWKAGFQYSTSRVFSDFEEVEGFWESEYIIVRTIDVLPPSTHYYYRAFLFQSGSYIYGETKEFTTLPVSSMIETLDYTKEQEGYVTLNGKVFISMVAAINFEFGFYAGESEDDMNKVYSYGYHPLKEQFSFKVSEDTFSGQLYYKAYVSLDGVEFFGELKRYEKAN